MEKEKVIKGLELCEIGSGDRCYETECPYYGQGYTESLKNDILELLKEQDTGEDMAARMDYYLRMIVDVFGRDEITLEVLDDILPVADVIPLYSQCVRYVFGLSVARLDKLPNAAAPTEGQN